MTVPEITYTTIKIMAIVILFTLYIVGLIKSLRAGSTSRRAAIPALTLSFLLLVYLVFNLREIGPADWAQIVLLFGLVVVTGVYALSTARQADASVKIAEETREQRIMSARPVIIQKAIHEDEKKIRAIEDSLNPNYFSHFEIYNAGNGPAIELEISLRDRLDREGTGLHSQRKTFLLAGKTLEFHPSIDVTTLDESKIYYLVCEYQGVLSHSSKTWYQSLLPFKPVKSSNKDRIYVNPDPLKFRDDVLEDERIDAFGWRSKQK